MKLVKVEATGAWGQRYVTFEKGDWETFREGHSHQSLAGTRARS